MHELGIVFHTIRTIEEVAAEQGLTRVGSVTLELGEVSGAIPQELVSCWDWAVNRTELLRGAPLKIETLPAVTHCEGCGENYPTVRHGRTCPYCGSEKTWLLRGNEISIKEIEAGGRPPAGGAEGGKDLSAEPDVEPRQRQDHHPAADGGAAAGGNAHRCDGGGH